MKKKVSSYLLITTICGVLLLFAVLFDCVWEQSFWSNVFISLFGSFLTGFIVVIIFDFIKKKALIDKKAIFIKEIAQISEEFFYGVEGFVYCLTANVFGVNAETSCIQFVHLGISEGMEIISKQKEIDTIESQTSYLTSTCELLLLKANGVIFDNEFVKVFNNDEIKAINDSIINIKGALKTKKHSEKLFFVGQVLDSLCHIEEVNQALSAKYIDKTHYESVKTDILMNSKQ